MTTENLKTKAKKSILIVDDDRMIVDLLKEYFLIHGMGEEYNIETFFSAQEAYDRISKGNFVFALFDKDLKSNEIDGRLLANYAKQQLATTHICMYTSDVALCKDLEEKYGIRIFAKGQTPMKDVAIHVKTLLARQNNSNGSESRTL